MNAHADAITPALREVEGDVQEAVTTWDVGRAITLLEVEQRIRRMSGKAGLQDDEGLLQLEACTIQLARQYLSYRSPLFAFLVTCPSTIVMTWRTPCIHTRRCPRPECGPSPWMRPLMPSRPPSAPGARGSPAGSPGPAPLPASSS